MQVRKNKKRQMQEKQAVTLDLGGFQGKLTNNAELLSILASIWDSKVGLEYFTNTELGALNELKNNFWGDWGYGPFPGLIKHKLLDSGHLYSTIFKLGAILWGAGELGLYTKYKSLGGKLAKGGAIAALLLPGSGPTGFVKNSVDSAGGYLKAPEGYKGHSNMGNQVKGY